MIPFELDRSQSAPIYRQLYQRFRESIADGRLRPGDRVPAVRALAAELNLARGTVDAAYQLLIGEGYLIARGAAGTVVTPQLTPAAAPRFAPRSRRRRIKPPIPGRSHWPCRWAFRRWMPFRANSGPDWRAVSSGSRASKVSSTRTPGATHRYTRPLRPTWEFRGASPATRIRCSCAPATAPVSI